MKAFVRNGSRVDTKKAGGRIDFNSSSAGSIGHVEKTLKHLPLLCAALLLVACHEQPPAGPSASTAQSRGHAFAQTSCGGCHAVERVSTSSPNPNAPPFSAIVNRQGLTAETLSSWLRDAHNYPSEMEFQLDSSKVDDLVAYMLTLSDPNYTPPI